MHRITKQQHANLVYARDVMWPAVRPSRVISGLNQWRCGSHACFGGHVAATPFFIKQGVHAGYEGTPLMGGVMSGQIDGCSVAEELFGSEELFLARGQCESDLSFTGTDHELVLHRVNAMLENCRVVE